MRYLQVVFLFSIIFVFMTSLRGNETGKRISKRRMSTRSLTDEAVQKMHVKLPRVMLRRYTEWASSSTNESTFLYHSIPMEATHIKDDIFRLTAEYRNTKSKILTVQLWIEFPNIIPSEEIQTVLYLIQITPEIGSIGSQDMNRFKHCKKKTFASRARFPGEILEIKFGITTVYEKCYRKKISPDNFTFRFRLYSLYTERVLDLTKEKVDMFLVFKEKDIFEDILHLLPNSENMERLHHSTITRKIPKLKSLSHRTSAIKVKGKKKCSLRPFVFNFDDSGWSDYVIAPKKYQSNTCRGDCSLPLPEHISSTNYVIIKAHASAVYKGMSNPVCSAKDLAPLTMLVRDEDLKITVKIQKDMIATSCKCA